MEDLYGIGGALLATSISDTSEAPQPSAVISIQDLKKVPNLWYKIHVFVYDLRNFRERLDSQNRLDSIADASYIGLPYFNSEEVAILKNTIVGRGKEGDKSLEAVIQDTLKDRLQRRMKKRIESGDYRVCAAHDLAPIFEIAFGIKPKELAKDDDFRSLLNSSGLKLEPGESWAALSKKTQVKQNQNKKKRGVVNMPRITHQCEIFSASCS